MPGGKELATSLLEELQERFRKAGRGSIKRVTAQLGVDRRYFLSWAQKGGSIHRLAEAIEALGVDPRLFFTSALGAALPEERIAEELHVEPRINIFSDVNLNRISWERDACMSLSEQEALEGLEALRYRDPGAVIQNCLHLLKNDGFRAKPHLLGVIATAFWHKSEFKSARHSLAQAFDRWGYSPAVKADVFCRAAPIFVYEEKYEIGALSAEQGALEAIKCGKNEQSGRSLVNLGLALYKLNRLREAEDAQQGALRLLAKSDHRHRFSALQGIGLYRQELGDIEGALEYIAAARREPDVPELLLVSLRWLEGRVADELENYRCAETCFRDVLHAYLTSVDTVAVANAAIVGCELVRVQIRLGKLTEARNTARDLTRIAMSIDEEYESVSEAILQLAYSQEISYELARQVELKISKRLGPKAPACQCR